MEIVKHYKLGGFFWSPLEIQFTANHCQSLSHPHLTYLFGLGGCILDLENDGRLYKDNQIVISIVAAVLDLVYLLHHINRASDAYYGWTEHECMLFTRYGNNLNVDE